jgi:hypothetical protein
MGGRRTVTIINELGRGTMIKVYYYEKMPTKSYFSPTSFTQTLIPNIYGNIFI